MNILFTICGRAGSKGLKSKNILSFLGEPLPFYSVSIIDLFIKEKKQYIVDIVLNTDSKELIHKFQELKIPIDIIKRESNLGLDSTPKVAVIESSLSEMQERKKKEYDMVVDLDITSPLRTLNDLKELVHKKAISDADVVFSVTESRRNPYFNMVMRMGDYFERIIKTDYNTRQESPKVYDMNASMYAYSPKFLLEKSGLFDGNCDVIIMRDTAVLDIDNQEDYELMELVGKYLMDNDLDYLEIKENIKNIKR